MNFIAGQFALRIAAARRTRRVTRGRQDLPAGVDSRFIAGRGRRRFGTNRVLSPCSDGLLRSSRGTHLLAVPQDPRFLTRLVPGCASMQRSKGLPFGSSRSAGYRQTAAFQLTFSCSLNRLAIHAEWISTPARPYRSFTPSMAPSRAFNSAAGIMRPSRTKCGGGTFNSSTPDSST